MPPLPARRVIFLGISGVDDVANGEKTNAVIGRLKEPSTWAGLAGLLAVFGLQVEQAQAVASVGSALAGALAVFLPERGR